MLKPSTLIALITLPLAITWHARADDTPKAFRVLLQGSSSDQLSNLVSEHGGTVTHRLHIINAVGARVTRTQLDAMLTSPLITRYLDDLDIDLPDSESGTGDSDCYIGGALQIDTTPNSLRWRLYDNGEVEAKLQQISLDWPPRLGELVSATVDGHPVFTGSPESPLVGHATLPALDTTSPTIGKPSVLELRFGQPITRAMALQQREITLEVSFSENCSTSLIPGYNDYDSDTYYPEVAGATALHELNVTGKGVTVAVLDSGLWEHKHLRYDTQGKDRVLGRYDAILDREGGQVFDESGHGTHMTSVIAHSEPITRGDSTGKRYKGIAPDVNIVAIKAFDTSGQGDFLDIIRGLQWVLDNQHALAIRVLNLSFAARPRWPYAQDPINQAVMRIWQAGITVVAAAGNEGPEAMTVGSPGNLPYIITVGAVTDSWTPETRNDDYIPDFSSRGPTPTGHIKPDLVAPGGHIAGVMRPGASLTKQHPDYMLNNGQFVMTGTSQASALVSGIAALLLQLEPSLYPNDIKCMLMSSAEPAINPDGSLTYSPFQQGSGYVSATRAVTLGKHGCANLDMNLALDLRSGEHYIGPAILDEQGNNTLPGLSDIYSGQAPAERSKTNLRWGAKAHIERNSDTPPENSPIDWLGLYLEEMEAINRLKQ